jgi:general secretion pathway protein G
MFILSPKPWRSTERNTPAGKLRMRTFFITAFGSRNARRPILSRRRGLGVAAFTLLEIMIVITIVMILAGIAATRYEKSVMRAREATLKQDLFVMRNAIQQYTLDKEAAPSSLDDLVGGKYLSAIPVDPITRNKDWKTDSDPVLLDPAQTAAGITDVHSGSEQVSPFENTAYNTW